MKVNVVTIYNEEWERTEVVTSIEYNGTYISNAVYLKDGDTSIKPSDILKNLYKSVKEFEDESTR